MRITKATVSKLWNSSSADLYSMSRRKIRRILGGGELGWDYSLEAILRNPKHYGFQNGN